MNARDECLKCECSKSLGSSVNAYTRKRMAITWTPIGHSKSPVCSVNTMFGCYQKGAFEVVQRKPSQISQKSIECNEFQSATIIFDS